MKTEIEKTEIETKQKLNCLTDRKRKVFSQGKGIIQNKSSSIQRRRVQTMLFKLHEIAGKNDFHFCHFRMVNFIEGTRNIRRKSSVMGEAKYFNNMIQISLDCSLWTDERLFHVIAHELGHTWLSLGHDDNCSLMHPLCPSEESINSIVKTCEIFSRLVESFKAKMK